MLGRSSQTWRSRRKHSTESRLFASSSNPPITTITLPVMTAVHPHRQYFMGGNILHASVVKSYKITLFKTVPVWSVPPIAITLFPQITVARSVIANGNGAISLHCFLLISNITTLTTNFSISPTIKILSPRSTTPCPDIGFGNLANNVLR